MFFIMFHSFCCFLVLFITQGQDRHIEFRPQTTFSTCHQKFAFRSVYGSGSGLRVIKNCFHITFTSLRAIFDELTKLLFWQFIQNCSQTFGSGTQEKYSNDINFTTAKKQINLLKSDHTMSWVITYVLPTTVNVSQTRRRW